MISIINYRKDNKDYLGIMFANTTQDRSEATKTYHIAPFVHTEDQCKRCYSVFDLEYSEDNKKILEIILSLNKKNADKKFRTI